MRKLKHGWVIELTKRSPEYISKRRKYLFSDYDGHHYNFGGVCLSKTIVFATRAWTRLYHNPGKELVRKVSLTAKGRAKKVIGRG